MSFSYLTKLFLNELFLNALNYERPLMCTIPSHQLQRVMIRNQVLPKGNVSSDAWPRRSSEAETHSDNFLQGGYNQMNIFTRVT